MIKKPNSRKNETIDTAETFIKTMGDLNISLADDSYYSQYINTFIKELDLDGCVKFYEELESHILSLEKSTKIHMHKGNIYWALSNYKLVQGDIEECITLLERAKDEDIKRDPHYKGSAAMLLSELKPLLYRYKKDKQNYVKDQEVHEFYKKLSDNEKSNFAKLIFKTHDMTVTGKVHVINQNGMRVLQNESTRIMFNRMHDEVRESVQTHSSNTTLGTVLVLGSMLESLIDDFYLRTDEKYWKEARKCNTEFTDTLKSEKYPIKTTLGAKIMSLRIWSSKMKYPIPKHCILAMIILNEYRDLIHPSRQMSFAFRINQDTSAFLFSLLNQIAGSFWDSEINKHLT